MLIEIDLDLQALEVVQLGGQPFEVDAAHQLLLAAVGEAVQLVRVQREESSLSYPNPLQSI